MTKRFRTAALTLAWFICTLMLARVLTQWPQPALALPNLTSTASPVTPATATMTLTPIVTPTENATATATPTPTPASQTTSQVTVEPVTSQTPTNTGTPKPTPSQTVTTTVTPNGSPTATPTQTPTETGTPNGSPSPAPTGDRTTYLPSIIQVQTFVALTCPDLSINIYPTINIESGLYKDNRLTDDNSDFRISVLGYTLSTASLGFVTYDGDTDLHAPNFYNIVRSPAHPKFIATYQRNDWTWDESGPPPYGMRGGPNREWPASVVDLAAVPGESVFIPSRNIPINSTGPFAAMVLYADEDELTVSYGTHDSVVDGYVVYLSNLCVDPSLVATYRAQLQDGRRFTGRLPVLLNTQPIGMASTNRVTVAVRDRAAFLDPRSQKDWWQDTPDARRLILGP